MAQRLTVAEQESLPPETRILDVRLESDYQLEHIPKAYCNCVFEVAFANRLSEILSSPADPVLVYGWDAASREAAVAVEKLERLGYEAVAWLEGGLEGWKAAGLPTEGGGRDVPSPAAPGAVNGGVEVDCEQSSLHWCGRNLLNRHHGTVAIEGGTLEFREGALVGGEFRIDLRRIRCEDLAGDPLHDVLIAHLHSDDFFDVGRFPTATFRILQVETRSLPPSSRNLRLGGELTLRGQTAPLEFDVHAGWTPDGRPVAQTAFLLDRTLWNIIYGSGRFFRNVAGHLVHDLIEFQVRIVGR